MELHKDAFFSLTLDEANSILIYVGFAQSLFMTDEETKAGFLKACAIMEQYHPNYYLSDSRQQKVILDPGMQEWIAQHVYPRWHQAGLKKLAIVIPEEVVANMAVHQAVDEIAEVKVADTYEIQFFGNAATAQEWLLESAN